ncbi:MAG: Ig-like domain-containing protein [Verrucomicrobiae bacterium]|nr:Ig-like domain-containing protein [Verrucomicrobiae bacterium]
MLYLASPRSGEVFIHPTNISLSAVAQSDAAAVSQVRIYANDQLLIADSTAPYAGFWPQAPVGQHQLYAVAVLANGQMLTSAPVAITVRLPEPAPPPSVTNLLIAAGARWQFFTGPTGAPPAWAAVDFDASGWSNGLAELGYGENDEATRLSYGTNSNNKWITAYFRHAFVVSDPYAITNAVLQLKRDDGAVVYLNGQEILRDLMPEGPIRYDTLATMAAEDDGKTFFSFPFAALPFLPGTNVLAVEVHQNAVTSSDLSFDLSLTVWMATNRPRGVYWVTPAAGAEAPAGALPLAVQVVSGGGAPFQRVAYYANGQWLAEVPAPFAWTWASPPVDRVELVAVASDGVGGSVTSAPVQVSFTAPPPWQSVVAWGEVWKYWDDRLPPAGAWTNLAYADQNWKAGAARLGYGGDGERTVIFDGGDPAFRHITAWFRKTFLANPAGLTQLELRLICDDGAVVYLNGQEVFRHNLPAGLISYNSLALTAVSGADETTPVRVTLSPTVLRSGTNVLAVEVHQNSITSSDLGFDLELIGRRMVPSAPATVYVTAPAQGARLVAPAAVTLTAFAVSNAQPAQRVEYLINGQRAGAASVYPYARGWTNPPAGDYVVMAVADFGGGVVMTSAPVALTVAPLPPPVQPVLATWIPAGATWRYWDNVAAVAPGWNERAFQDAAWPVGQARFGWGWDGERTELTAGRITHYFRYTFTVTNPALYTEMVFQLVRDDGAVVYLNGREVFRSNMPEGTVTAATLAAGTVNTPEETTFFETVVPVAGAGLVAGTNVVAVELHQSSATSSDGGFDMQLIARGTTEPRLWLLRPARDEVVVAGQPLILEAAAWTGLAPAGETIEFYAGAQKIGETAPGETQWTWANPALGVYAVSARLRLASGVTLVSAPVTVTVQYPPYVATLISTGAVWRYWDRGTLPATNWARRGYSDAAWSAGPGRLGYGDDGEVTVLQTGPTNNKYTAYYFRRWFSVPSGVTLTNLVFRLLRDDGAVVYLNGGEVFRSNMPPGPVGYATLASSAVSGADEQTYFEFVVPVAGVLGGLNLVAVEIHQNSATSSDLAFDLALEGRGFQGPPPTAVAPPPEWQAGQLQLLWPTNMHGWELYSSPTLGPEALWQPVAGTLLQTNGFYLFRTAPTGASRYFRLEQR